MIKTREQILQYHQVWKRKRCATDPEYQQKCNEYGRDQYRRRYKTDPEFMQRRRKNQRIRWRERYYSDLKFREKKKEGCRKNKSWLKPEYKQYRKLYCQRNRDKLREYHKKYSKEWEKNNPRASRHYSIELQLAMNNVRKRDHNTCQWQNCGLTHREASIHVHHIFPKSEYPELELIEHYMICYCEKHHGIWHEFRGDGCSSFLFHKNH